jgi:eukaryotic-like serine/threonine-protein kinase
MDILIGRTLQHGKYTITEELGRGGFGMTYKANHSFLRQPVVIKTLNLDLRSDKNFEKQLIKFQDEARRLAVCVHPNIVRINDFFVEDTIPYMVMDYIPGQTLQDIVFPKNPLSEAIAIHYIKQISQAVKVIHNQGLLHRDIKPNNIILKEGTEQVILIDFGIAREFTPGKAETHTGIVSEGYAPIEQYLEKEKRTQATDIYALAATLYALVTAKTPTPASLRTRQNLRSPKEINSELSATVNQAIMQGMAMEMNHRPATVDQWLKLLPETDDDSITYAVENSTETPVKKQFNLNGINYISGGLILGCITAIAAFVAIALSLLTQKTKPTNPTNIQNPTPITKPSNVPNSETKPTTEPPPSTANPDDNPTPDTETTNKKPKTTTTPKKVKKPEVEKIIKSKPANQSNQEKKPITKPINTPQNKSNNQTNPTKEPVKNNKQVKTEPVKTEIKKEIKPETTIKKENPAPVNNQPPKKPVENKPIENNQPQKTTIQELPFKPATKKQAEPVENKPSITPPNPPLEKKEESTP